MRVPWIKCEDALPTEDGRYLVTYKIGEYYSSIDVCDFAVDMSAHTYDELEPTEGFYSSDTEWGYIHVDNVYAWCPLHIEPYDENYGKHIENNIYENLLDEYKKLDYNYKELIKKARKWRKDKKRWKRRWLRLSEEIANDTADRAEREDTGNGI
jgi:hypothetical protein